MQRTAGHPLPEVVRTAITALGLDIDLLLAERMRHPDAGNRAASHAASSLDAMLSLVDTYLQEIAAQGTPSLRAFISWVDSLRDASDDNATAPDTPVDVVLMTVHQSKGLEWDAVAVVGMRDGTFPSSQGDHLSVKTDEDHPGRSARRRMGAARNTSKKPTLGWKTRSTVPVPVRADADILPRFPHDAPIGGNPVESLDGLDDAEVIDDEVFGTLRTMAVDDMEGMDPASLYLTQQEEYGRRLHADERRLAYVALTRAPLRGAARIQRMQRDEPRLPPGGGKEKRRAVEFLAGDARFDERNRHRGTRTGQPVRRCGRLPAHAGT